MTPRTLLSFGLALLLPAVTSGELTVAGMFTSHMVLQQGMPTPVWGKAAAGEVVTVEFTGQRQQTTANRTGDWLVKLAPLSASAEPRTLTITGSADTGTIELFDVLVGEVWFASGQSNMQMPVGNKIRPDAYPGVENFTSEVEAANHPHLRLFKVRAQSTLQPAHDLIGGNWQVCTPQSAETFSAAAYFFGRYLLKHVQAPIGIIVSAQSSTTAEQWMSLDSLAEFPQFAGAVAFYRDPATVLLPKQELSARSPAKHPSLLFNCGVAPVIPFAIRGAIWYQGESNVSRAEEYRKLLPALIRDWRRQWTQGDFPFLLVQLAGFKSVPQLPGEDAWAELREAQALTAASMTNVFLATALDIGMVDRIHPVNKREVGRRLGLVAREKVYGQKTLSSGPMFRKMTIQGARVLIDFDSPGAGLVSRNAQHPGRVSGFAIAGGDRQWMWAEAELNGNTCVVSCPKIADPVAVRYGWARNLECDLYNEAGLPALPFRTDDWPLSTAGKRYEAFPP
jgi:sialate O-acetylesterase